MPLLGTNREPCIEYEYEYEYEYEHEHRCAEYE
jgi:hypothetical protein